MSESSMELMSLVKRSMIILSRKIVVGEATKTLVSKDARNEVVIKEIYSNAEICSNFGGGF